MATTTNFGWTTPNDTDLVKDGAAAIRTALGGPDTSFVGLKGGTTGQVLSKTSATDLAFTWVAQDDSNAIQNAIVDAKGDLIAATANDTPARLAVGTDGQVLTAASGQSTGLQWATPSSGGMTVLSSGSLSGASVTISSISGSYKNLQLVVTNALPSAQAGLRVRFNSDSASNYLNVSSSLGGTSQTYSETYATLSSDQHTSGTNLSVMDVYDYANATSRKLAYANSITQNNATPNYNCVGTRSSWNSTAAITAITILFYSGTISSGSYVLYGVK